MRGRDFFPVPFFLFLLAFFHSFAHAQNALPTPTPQSAPLVTPVPTPSALPSNTPGVAATPSPASLPSVVPDAPTRIEPDIFQPVRGFGDPNRVLIPAPVLVATPTPAPLPTTLPTPEPDVDAGEIAGEELPGGVPILDVPDGVIYDMERGLALAQGAVTFRYRGLTVKGQRGVVDNNAGTATLTGDLTLTAQAGGRSQTFTGKTLVFNLKTGKWVLTQIKTTFPPEFFPPGTVLAPLYETDGLVVGQGENGTGENFRFSSCDREHYYLRSNRIEFYRTPSGEPGRIVLRKNALFVFGQKILPLPVYTISLLGQTSRRQPLQTTFGQNEVDGFFARTLYDLRATEKFSDSLLIDALSKRGLGLGFQRQLIGGGLLYLYGISGKSGGREINARLSKRYQISKLVSSDLNFQSTQNNSVAGSGIASRSGNFSLQRAGTFAQTSLNYNFDASSFSGLDSSSGSSSRTDSLIFQHQQQFGAGLSLSVDGDLNQSKFGSASSGEDDANGTSLNQTGDLNVQVGKTSRLLDVFLRSELHPDFARGNSAFQLERLPELLLQSDTQRLQSGFLNRIAPGDFTLSVGTFNEPVNTFGSGTGTDSIGGQKNRANFRYNLRDRSKQLIGNEKNGSALSAAGTFEQAFYSGNTARYNYAYNFNNTTNAGPVQVAINYNKQRTYGFTPFQFDFATPGEYVDYTASVGRGENFRLNINGGRDIQNDYTRDILTNIQWIPSRGTYLSLGTSYALQSTRRGLFGDIYGNLRFSRRQTRTFGGQFSLGFRYTPSGTGSNQGLTRVNASFDTNITRKIRFQTLAGYDGINNRFDFQQYRAIVDLHCFNLFTTYDGTRKELRFDLALKAFPFADTRFGRNGFSEGFDAGVGEVR